MWICIHRSLLPLNEHQIVQGIQRPNSNTQRDRWQIRNPNQGGHTQTRPKEQTRSEMAMLCV
jgi:hypothetical protein